MALVFGKAVMNCSLGLLIQAIEILGLELLEVLWDGVCEQKQAPGLERDLHRNAAPPHPAQAACRGHCQPAQQPATISYFRLLGGPLPPSPGGLIHRLKGNQQAE